jgi:hypothetical protein
MNNNDMKRPFEASLDFLLREAGHVARGMAALREAQVKRLCGLSAVVPDHHPSRAPQSFSEERGHVGFSPFYYYPFLFASAFPSVTVEDLRRIAMANRVLLEAILLTDKKIDETRPWTPKDLCLVDTYFHKALELLIPLFPLEHMFWAKTQEWYLQHARAILKEQRRHRYRLYRYTKEEFFEISTGKVALIKTNLMAMGLLSDAGDALASLMESQDRFLAGFQCFDDLRDWKEDLRHGNYTYLLTKLLLEAGFHHPFPGDESFPFDGLGQVLYHRGVADDQLRMAEQYFRDALAFAKPIHVPCWAETIRCFLRHCHTMRLDLSEIKRRTATRMVPKAVSERMDEALGFILRSSGSFSGFPLARSACPYMHPSTPLAPSRFVTYCLKEALTPFRNMDSRAAQLLDRTTHWLSLAQSQPHAPSLPYALEESFCPIRPDPGRLSELDESLRGSLPLCHHSLYWAHLLLTASKADIHLPKLRSLVEASICQADYRAWTRIPPRDTAMTAPNQAVCHPLLVLLLFCHACGPDLPRGPLYDYLLKRNGITGNRSNPTEIALTLLCLLATGYQGPEQQPAVERLYRTQEADGSWPPNAVYEQDGLFYGSRELTTAWCLLALFVHQLGNDTRGTRRHIPLVSEPRAAIPEVLLNRGLKAELRDRTVSALKDLREVLPPPWPQTLFIGTYPCMPPHFLLTAEQGVVIGLNVLPANSSPARSTGGRSLQTEIIMATMSAHRCLRLGPLRDRLERLFVAGLALSCCARLFQAQSPWERLGMRKLDWAWCREHEAFLWEELTRFLLHPFPRRPAFRWLLPEQPASPDSPIPKGASLFLGERLFEDSRSDQELRRKLNELLGKTRPEVLLSFRRKVGLHGPEKSVA